MLGAENARGSKAERGFREGGDGLRRLFVGEARCRKSKVRYYLLEGEPEEPGSFGVEIEMDEEKTSAANLSPSRERVLALAEALSRGAVTPVALRDVVDDWLLE